MLFPYRSDAPVYHWPIVTVSCLLLNILIFASVDVYAIDRWWVLRYQHIDPLRWLTSAFAHADIYHLLGNMLFLWSFGLIVEGRIGWLRFLGVYAVAVALGGLVEQLLMYGQMGGSLGASGVIYSLMVISAIWSPRSEVDSLFVFGRFTRTVTTRVSTLVWFYVAWDLVQAMVFGFGLSTALLHSIGALVGLPIALLMLRWEWVDCDGWDAVSLWRSMSPKRRKQQPATTRVSPPTTASRGAAPGPVAACASQGLELESTVQSALANGQALAAFTAWERFELRFGRWQLDDDRLLHLARCLGEADEAEAADTAWQRLTEQAPVHTNLAMLERARLQLYLRRPQRALAMLEGVQHPNQAEHARQATLRQHAEAMAREGVLEIL